jgi:hypothetical protein
MNRLLKTLETPISSSSTVLAVLGFALAIFNEDIIAKRWFKWSVLFIALVFTGSRLAVWLSNRHTNDDN